MLPLALLVTLCVASLTSAFSFTFDDNPTQCNGATLSWTGGQAPYNMTIIPSYDYPYTLALPDVAYNSTSGRGNYKWVVSYPAGTEFVVMMSDGTGTGTGGVSPLYKVTGTQSANCQLRSTHTDFMFYLNETALTQCNPVNMYWDNTATSPVAIIGAIPGGQVFQLVSANSVTRSLVWDTNIAAGTQVILAAFDHGAYGNGGTSALMTIGASSDSSCLDDSSPSSTTAGSPTATGTTSGKVGGVKTVTSVTTQTAIPKGAAGLSTGAIVGIALSAVMVVLAIQVALFWFCCRRHLKALIYHRREMRGKEIKPGGEVDLGLATRGSGMDYEDDDDPYSAQPFGAGAGGGSAKPGSARHRDDRLDPAYAISPFLDHNIARQTSGTPPTIGSMDFDFDLPRIPGGLERRDSFADSIGQSLHELDLAPSPSLSATGFSPTSPLVPTRSSHTLPTRTFASSPAQGHSSAHGQGPIGSMSKAQLAASLSTANPDRPSQPELRAEPESFGAKSPPQRAPPGGFRRHEDAGPVPRRLVSHGEQDQDVEDLPPLYRPEWDDRQPNR
ncbi:hypothetical protein IAU60_006146 [Kwoniella sp. DSM 27419]